MSLTCPTNSLIVFVVCIFVFLLLGACYNQWLIRRTELLSPARLRHLFPTPDLTALHSYSYVIAN